MTNERYFVVGGGISGLAATHYLRGHGLPATLLERAPALGGRIGAGSVDGQPVEFGGKNIGQRYHLFRALVADLGVAGYEPFGINTSRVVDGRVARFDGAARVRGFLAFLRRCPPRDLARFARFYQRVRRHREDGFLGSGYFTALAERFGDPPLASYFGAALTAAVIRPMAVRMNGAEPDEAHLGNLGSNLGMLLDSFDQLSGGMSTVLDAFAARHEVWPGTEVRAIAVHGGQVAGLTVVRDGRPEHLPCTGVVLATPAPGTARLLAPILPRAAALLAQIRYFPVSVVLARYAEPVFTPQVRALLFDAGEVISNAGAYGTAALDTVRYTFSGRAARQLLAATAQLPEPERTPRLLAAAEQALGRHLRLDPARRRWSAARHFDPGLCAYGPHHAARLAELHRTVGAVKGLYLTGDYVAGASLEACCRAAQACVRSLVAAHTTVDLPAPSRGGRR